VPSSNPKSINARKLSSADSDLRASARQELLDLNALDRVDEDASLGDDVKRQLQEGPDGV
jgi:hypothetical protein